MNVLANVVIIALMIGLVVFAFKLIHALKHPHYESDEEKRTK